MQRRHKKCSFILGYGRSPGVGNGNPLEFLCVENSMDRGAWWVTVHGVTHTHTQVHYHRLLEWAQYNEWVLKRKRNMVIRETWYEKKKYPLAIFESGVKEWQFLEDGKNNVYFIPYNFQREMEPWWNLDYIYVSNVNVEFIIWDGAVKVLHSVYQQIWKTHQWP